MCKVDEYSENAVIISTSELTTKSEHLRPRGNSFGEDLQLVANQEIEVWTTLQDKDMPYGWYLANVVRIKKNVIVFTTKDKIEYIEPMTTKQSIRLPNGLKMKVDEFSTEVVEVPEKVVHFMEEEFGLNLIKNIKDKVHLQETTFDEYKNSITLSGLKESVLFAKKFLLFNFENLQYVNSIYEEN